MKILNLLHNIFEKLENDFCESNFLYKIFAFLLLPSVILFIFFAHFHKEEKENTIKLQQEVVILQNQLQKIPSSSQVNIFDIKLLLSQEAKKVDIELQKSIYENNILYYEFEGDFENIMKFAFFAEKTLKKFDILQFQVSKDFRIKLIMKVILEEQ